MAEYIDRQVVVDALKQLPHEYKTKEQRARTGGVAACQVIVKDVPAADVRPVVRGKWIKGRNDKWVCSECQVGNHYAYSWDSITEDYTHLQDFFCPHCGADMRGVTDG